MKKYIKFSIYSAVAVVLIAAAFFLFRLRSVKVSSSVSNKVFSTEAATLLKNAGTLEEQGDLDGAKQLYQRLLYSYPDAEEASELQDKIASLNIKILFSPMPTDGSQLYEVKPGDSLIKIAKEFNTTVELIKKANNLSGNLIKPGMKLKVQNRGFSIVVDKSQNTLTLVLNGEVIKVYSVSTGKSNSTPIGMFKIVNKLIDPPWYSAEGVISPDSPENVLGTRWLGIDRPGYGIHGTNDPGSVGYQCTKGCVRMYNGDVEELYAIVPRGTKIKIIN